MNGKQKFEKFKTQKKNQIKKLVALKYGKHNKINKWKTAYTIRQKMKIIVQQMKNLILRMFEYNQNHLQLNGMNVIFGYFDKLFAKKY